MMRRFAALALAGLMTVGLTACGPRLDPDEAQESVRVYAMDTEMVFSVYGQQSVKVALAAEAEMYRLENLLSRTREDSAISKLNAAGGAETPVGAEVCALLLAAETYSWATGGAFDVTLAAVSSAWGFTEDAYRVPPQVELEALLTRTGMDKVQIAADTAALAEGTQIDLGAIAKGYAADRAAALLREYDAPRAMVNLGGNVLAWGNRPDGEAWRVGIQDPAQPMAADAYVGILNLTDAYAVTSGGYQRYFEEAGTTYHHIIDPATGHPAASDLTSVTIVAAAETLAAGETGPGTLCDALSTALFVLGEDRAVEFWRSGAYPFDMVLVTAEGRVVTTPGLVDRLTTVAESGYVYETVS